MRQIDGEAPQWVRDAFEAEVAPCCGGEYLWESTGPDTGVLWICHTLFCDRFA